MTNTSATGGYLSPDDLVMPEIDTSLDAILQKLVVGITGMDGSLVRPRWQPVMPKQPDLTVTWASIGVTKITADAGPVITYIDDLNKDRYERHEKIDATCIFYGPSSQEMAHCFRDGLAIRQNNDPLRAYRMTFVDADPISSVPELINQQWIKRYEFALRLRRQVVRHYDTLSFTYSPLVTLISN